MSRRGGDTHGAVYAQALAEAADARGLVVEVGAEIAALSATWQADGAVRAFFLSGAVHRTAKTEAIERVFRGRSSDVFADFLQVLLRRNRLWIVPEAGAAYERLLDVRLGRVPVTLTTAAPASEAELAGWRARIRAAVGREPVLRHLVRPALLGGAVIRVGDVVADGSVRRSLAELQTRLRRAGDLSHAST